MAKKTPIINDFRSGEMAPGLDARADIKQYYKGCRVLLNAMPLVEGGAERAPGTYYVRPVKLTEEGWTLRVTKSGTGTGVVTSDVAGINCGSSCYSFFAAGTTVVLTATPTAGQSFIGWSGDGTGTTTRTVLMDGNKVVNAEFSLFPTECMWAWFKHNEGSGLNIIDYSPLSVNGIIVDTQIPSNPDLANFWGAYPGFGYQGPPIWYETWVQRYSTARSTKYCSLIGFVKPISFSTFGLKAFQLGESGLNNILRLGWTDSVPAKFKIGGLMGIVTTDETFTFGNWYCLFATAQLVSKTLIWQYFVRGYGYSDWELIGGGTSGGIYSGITQQGVFAFGAGNYSGHEVIGDVLYYACDIPSGILSGAQATNIYNSLKSRYGL